MRKRNIMRRKIKEWDKVKCPLCHKEYEKEELKYSLMRFYGSVTKVCEKCKDDAFIISQKYLGVKNNK